ncbi:hypothetical protein [Stenotrophomonas maltophilia]|uniref:hypothetical protein n=1 Tax=Stenotrophomonas maltophilia TaxID=40324 RepID=UPI00209B0824|nr:hypothetical protein [Stenotrophomonas maltophilia]MCO7488862.1 hypothetical protein [Stenotrophomonas maltophilia]
MAATSGEFETFFMAAFVTRMQSAGFPTAVTIVAQSFRIRMLPALVALGMVVSPAAFADGDEPGAVRTITSEQALQDLTAVIECRAPASVQKALSRHLWAVALGDEVLRIRSIRGSSPSSPMRPCAKSFCRRQSRCSAIRRSALQYFPKR